MTTQPDTDLASEANASTTARIVDSLTRAIVDHRLHPGTKLAEQKLAEGPPGSRRHRSPPAASDSTLAR